MATESPIRLLEGNGKWPPGRRSISYGSSPSANLTIEDFGLFLSSQRFQSLEKDMIPIPSRSGSAPPSMEGSIAAIRLLYPSPSTGDSEIVPHPSFPHGGSLVSLDEQVKGPSDSWENSRLFQCSGSTGNDWKITSHAESADGSAQLRRDILPSHEEVPEDDRSSERSASVDKAAMIGDHSGSLDSTQEDFPASSPSHSWSHKSVEQKVVSDADSHEPFNLCVSTSSVGTNNPTPILDDLSQVFQYDLCAAAVQSLSLDDGVKAPSAPSSDHHKFHRKEQLNPHNYTLQQQATLQEGNISLVQGSNSQAIHPAKAHAYGSLNQFHYGPSSVSKAEVQPILQTFGFTSPFYAPEAFFMTPQNPCYPNLQPAGFFTQQYGMGGYPFSPAVLPPYLAGYPPQGAVPLAFDSASFPTSGASDGSSLHDYDMQNLQKFYGQVGVSMQPPHANPYHMQYFQPTTQNSYGAYYQFDHEEGSENGIVSQENARDLKKGPGLIGFQNEHGPQHSAGAEYKNLNIGRGNISNHYSLGSPTNISHTMHFPSASFVSPVPARPVGGTNFLVARNNTSHSHSFYGNSDKTHGPQNQSNYIDSYSFLEELKSGKGQRFELSDIVGHIGEFSVDQHGSRFIQQKLENCSIEEKASVFKEVGLHASKLMTDVFGNYVIQKLFEYGSPDQKKDLANQLESKILQLSLQMYGCRVIQKAFEVIDLEQKVQLARELDGHVLRCVRDQNGNHVIQKCIEGIPAENIDFIISSFRGQVATLSMHPYGCRVIQRVLENCNDGLLQTQFIVNEILDSVYSLAQDQYGNYVAQHALKWGIPRERTEIIEKLSGSIVQLSLHKFASNVVEKCLEYGDATARDMLIKEIIGNTEKNDNILIMMKDQYANYVIQKILQKCTSDQRELLIGLIRNHLTALKKYTYGKHIVARFEQLYEEEIQT